jgi:uncharacterized protein HemY
MDVQGIPSDNLNEPTPVSTSNVFRQVMAYRCLEEDLPEEADESLKKAIALDTKDSLVLLSRCERAGDKQQQEELKAHLASWREQEPWGDYLAVSGMADLFYNRAIAQGLEKLHLFTRLRPLSLHSWGRLAHASAALAQFEAAKRHGQHVLALQPISPQTFHTLGIVAVNEERFDDGIRHFDRALANSRPSVVNLRPLAHCYKETGDRRPREGESHS